MSDIWTVLAARGRIADLNIGRPRASVPLTLFVDEVTKKRQPDEVLPDLGVTTRSDKQRKAVEDYIRVGYKVLLPPRYEKAWRSAETGARRSLLRDASETGNGYIYAFRTPFGSFIPVDNLDKWLEAIEEYKRRYMAVAKELIANHDAVRREVVENFVNIARMTYTNLMKEDPALLRGVTQADFCQRYVKVVKAYMPSPQEIKRDTYFRWSLRDISLPEADRKRAIADAALRPEERERIKTLNRTVEMVLDASKSDLTQFESDVNQQLLSVVFNASEMAYRYLNASGTVPPKMSLMLDKLADQVKGLNVLDDKEVVKWADDLRSAIHALRAASPNQKGDAYDDLKSVVTVVRDSSSRRLARFGGAIRTTWSNEPSAEPTERVERRQRGAA